jgi:hypothetical protein
MKKYSLFSLSIIILLLISLFGCKKKEEESGDPKVTVTVLVNPEFFNYKAFIALFSGDDDNPVFHAAGYITLQPMQLNSIELLQVNENILGTSVAHIPPGDYYIGVYLDMNNSTTNLNDMSTWMPDAGDYEMEVQAVNITEDTEFTFGEFYKVAEPGKLTVQIHDADILQDNPLYYNVLSKDDDTQILSAGRIVFPLTDFEFTAMETDQSQEKVFDGGEYRLQVYCDLDHSQSDYSIGDPFYANFGDILSEIPFEIDEDVTVYFNEDYHRIGYARIAIELCGLDEYGGATSYLTFYKNDGGSETIYATADQYYQIYSGCYTYTVHSYTTGPEAGYYELADDYLIRGIVDIDSSSYDESNWENIIASPGDLELNDYPVELLGDTTISISLDEFQVAE